MFNRRAVSVLLTLTVAACTAGDTAEDQPATTTPKVLVIGIDGVRPDVLAEVPTPNVDALIADGAYTDQAQTGLPSVSGPGWSSFLNGVWPEKHGVTNNDFTGKRYDLYPDFLTRIEQVRPELNTFAVADWLPLIQAEDGMPTISDAVDVRPIVDGHEHGYPLADSMSVELAAAHLREADPDALFVYLGNPDEASHDFSSIGEEYHAAIALADRHVGVLMEAVRSRPTYDTEDWLVVVSTDHGRREDGGHGGDTPEERTIFLLVSGPAAAKAFLPGPIFIVDVSVTALTHLGIDIDPAWDLDGKPVGLARSGGS